MSRKICCVKSELFQILYAVEKFSSLFLKDKLKQGTHICCGSVLSLVQIFFSFVSNSLSCYYHTLPYPETGVLTTRGLTTRGLTTRGFLKPGVLQPGVLTTRGVTTLWFLQPGVLTTWGSYHQGSYNQGFLQPMSSENYYAVPSQHLPHVLCGAGT